MSGNRSKRFLIDSIDERLGNVEKEKKFDLIMVAVGVVLIIAGILLIALNKEPSKLAVLYIFMIMLGVFLAYAMTKEYIDDCKKAKNQNK